MRSPITTVLRPTLGLSLILCSSALALTNDSDQVVLFNGDHITGHLLSTSDETVSILTEAAGTINIHRAAIKEVIAQPKEVVQIQAPKPPEQPSVPCMLNAKPVPSSWAFTLQGAPGKVVLGTQSQEQFGAGLDLRFCEGSPRDITEITAKGSHSRTYKEKSTSIQTDVAGAEIVQQHFLRGPQGAAIYGVGELFTNNSLGMAMQKSAGLGVLSPQYHYKSLFYDFAADARYLNQHLDHTSPSLNLGAVRLKEQMHSQGSIFSWNEQAWVMPVFNDVHALQAYASLGPSISLKPWLRLGLTEEESYLGNAPRPNRKNYFSSVLSLTIQGSGAIR